MSKEVVLTRKKKWRCFDYNDQSKEADYAIKLLKLKLSPATERLFSLFTGVFFKD